MDRHEGLKPGDRVIVEGQLRVRPGMTVNPLPYRPASAASGKPGRLKLIRDGGVFHRPARFRDRDRDRHRHSRRGRDPQSSGRDVPGSGAAGRYRSRPIISAVTRSISRRPSPQPIEEQLAGLDGMLYFLSTSANNGSITIVVTFELGTNPDTATVQTQNKVNIALPRLPPEVQRQGVVVKKVSTAFLMAVALVSPDNRYDALFLNNYAQINLLNQLGSLPGVGDSRLTSAQVYSMRVWVDPDKMAKLGLTATDISNAINAQNRQNPAGAVGQAPAPPGTDFQYSVNAPGRLDRSAAICGHRDSRAAGRFSASNSRHWARGAGRADLCRLQPVQRPPSANVMIFLSPGANAVDTANRVKAFMEQAKKISRQASSTRFPTIPRMFVRAAISRRDHDSARSASAW